MGLSDASVCGVAGNAASTSVCFVLLAFLTGTDSCEVFVDVVVLSSFRLRVIGGVFADFKGCLVFDEAADFSQE